MQTPLTIDFLNMEGSDTVEARVRERARRLERHWDRIVGCRVTIERPHRQHHKGNAYHVRIVVSVPGSDIVVSRAPGDMAAHTDIYVAIRDAFDAAERQLDGHVDKLRGAVKTHEPPMPQGRIVRLFATHGFIATTDGREIYFHRNSVVDGDFDALKEDQTVELTVMDGESPVGPQASTVRPISALKLAPQPG